MEVGSPIIAPMDLLDETNNMTAINYIYYHMIRGVPFELKLPHWQTLSVSRDSQ